MSRLTQSIASPGHNPLLAFFSLQYTLELDLLIMPPKKGTKSKGKGKAKAKAATPAPAQEVPVQSVDQVHKREEAKQTPMEVDSTSVDEVKAEESVAPTTNDSKGMTPQERAQKLAALRAKMVCHYRLFLSTN